VTSCGKEKRKDKETVRRKNKRKKMRIKREKNYYGYACVVGKSVLLRVFAKL
jgi:hypothetical protein